ncbi:MAG: hypothetical protein JST12_03565 [Armatimonadetes bacterium]|nr:hypothetical protein [Armatimonadota bacterium]
MTAENVTLLIRDKSVARRPSTSQLILGLACDNRVLADIAHHFMSGIVTG